MPSGPILTWTPEHSEKAEEYLQYFIDSAMDEEPSYNQQVLPSIAGRAVKLNMGRTTLYSRAEHEETGFADILGRVNRFRESFLLNNGLNGNYNPTIAKLILN